MGLQFKLCTYLHHEAAQTKVAIDLSMDGLWTIVIFETIGLK